MAGKKKHNDDVGLSKTARASKGKVKKEGFIAAAPENLKRIISLGGGTHAYILDPRNGLTRHLAVGSDKFNALIFELSETEHGVNIRAELKKLGWTDPVTVRDNLMAEVEANDAALFAAIEATEIDPEVGVA